MEESRFSPKNMNCTLCGLCVRACEATTGDRVPGEGVMTFRGRGKDREVMTPFEIAPDECKGCEACVSVCPTDALEMVEIEEEE